MSEKFIVETSARHVHLTAEAFAVMLGEGKELTVKKMLSQQGQFDRQRCSGSRIR